MKDNKLRMILNLKNLNGSVENHHFKMETLKHALALVVPLFFFCSFDFKDAYFSVHINEESQNFLKFEWGVGVGGGQLFKSTVFSNELACCPTLFAMLLKPVTAALQRQDCILTIFIDDTLLTGLPELDHTQNVKASLELLGKSGFVVHPVKSVPISSHTITSLGFEINSSQMTITLTRERKVKIYNSATKLLNMGTVSSQTLAKFIGQEVASFQGVKFGPLWYKALEKGKITALREGRGDYESPLALFNEAKTEILWWKEHVFHSCHDIDSSHREPDLVIFSDTSWTGWGSS